VTDLRDRHEPAAATRRARWWPGMGTALFAAAAAVGALVRVWQLRGRGDLVWADSKDFLTSARAPWASLALWAGPRTAAVPAVLKVVGQHHYVALQAAVAVLCWAALAAVVGAAVGGRVARWLAAGAVVAFSLTQPVVMWERSLLSESLAVSLTALVAAAVVQLCRGVTGWRVAALLAATAAWLTTRDTHAVVAAVGGAAVALGLAVDELWWRRHGSRAPGPDAGEDGTLAAPPPERPGRDVRRALTALALGALTLGFVSAWGADHGHRQAYPMRNVFEVRVLPYPDRVRWFGAHGMPQADAFAGPGARAPFREAGQAPVVYVPDHDPDLGPWLDWIGGDGARRAYLRFAATHPLYLVTEPLRSPERAFNNAHGDRAFYAPQDLRNVPMGSFVLPTWLVLLVGAMVGGWALAARRWSPVLGAGVVVAVLAVPHGLAAWHSDGMETARHLVVPALQLHLGVLIMVVGALAAAHARPVVDPLRSGDG
jgi:hypothetical protein